MTTFTTLSDVSLSQDKPVTQSIARAWRDNPLAIGEGDATAPRVIPAALNFPYFMANRSTSQISLSSSATKILCNVEDFDPDGLYNSVTNFRFIPNKAGLYMVGVYAQAGGMSTSATQIAAYIYKNGASIIRMVVDKAGGTTAATAIGLAQMNGTTDYLEGFVSFPNDGHATNTLIAARFWAYAVCEV